MLDPKLVADKLEALEQAAKLRWQLEEQVKGYGNDALLSVVKERIRQDAKWGEQNHNPYIYLAILLEEVGELAQSILQSQFGGEHGGPSNVRTEAIHTAAVALSIVECLDRAKWIDNDVHLQESLYEVKP